MISKNIIYTCSLLILPVLISVSWLNVFFGNANYSPLPYTLMFVLPAALTTYGISLLAAESLNMHYGYSYKRVLFTLVALVDMLLLYSIIASMLGLHTQFLTASIPSIQLYENNLLLESSDPREIASKFYSFQLIAAMLAIVVAYAIAIVAFPDKKTLTRRSRRK